MQKGLLWQFAVKAIPDTFNSHWRLKFIHSQTNKPIFDEVGTPGHRVAVSQRRERKADFF